MKKAGKWIPYLFFIGAALAAGGISYALSAQGMKSYSKEVIKPPLTPPDAVFPVVWSVLYVLMGIGAGRIYRSAGSGHMTAAGKTRRAFALWWGQLGLNFLWSHIFFGLGAYGAAFICLVVMVLAVLGMILEFLEIDRRAGLLQIPYLAWLSFAGYLNLGVWKLNG